MSMRFTDTEKWNDPWFCKLGESDKLFWVYLCDSCNHAGIFKVNWSLINFHIPKYDFNKAVFNGRIVVIDEETWFVEKFILFQQKINSLTDLNPQNNCHKSILSILESKKLLSPSLAPSQPLARGLGKGKGKGKGKKKGIVKGKQFDFESVWNKYPLRIGKKDSERHFIASVKTEEDFDNINIALGKYLQHLKNNEWKKAQNGSTWLNTWQEWVHFKEPDGKSDNLRNLEEMVGE